MLRRRPGHRDPDPADLNLRSESPDSAASSGLLAEYEQLIRDRIGRLDVELLGLPQRVLECRPPLGEWLVGYEGTMAVACGGIRGLEPGVAEVKTMFVTETARGKGVGRQLLEGLERAAGGLGYEQVRLDSSSSLPEALALYRSAGYSEIERYNENPDCDLWFEKALRD